jgi:hypothetical protein
MSKATMDLHHNIKKPIATIFESILVFIGVIVFPGGLLLMFLLGVIQEAISFPDYWKPVIILAIGLFAVIYHILDSINKNLEIHKAVIIELIKHEAQKD